jgi:hypothetical protein
VHPAGAASASPTLTATAVIDALGRRRPRAPNQLSHFASPAGSQQQDQEQEQEQEKEQQCPVYFLSYSL